jgi:magnesium transporter
MKHIFKEHKENSFEWLDVNNPTESELNELVLKYNLPETAIKDCLDPEHLPKFEQFEKQHFIITRNYDNKDFTRVLKAICGDLHANLKGKKQAN